MLENHDNPDQGTVVIRMLFELAVDEVIDKRRANYATISEAVQRIERARLRNRA